MGSSLAKLVNPPELGRKQELFVLRSLQRSTCRLGLVFQQLLWHSRAQGMRSHRQCLSRRTVGWGFAGLAPKGGCGGWITCSRAPGAGVGVLWGIIFQQMGADGSSSLGCFQPSFPTALAASSFILGQRFLIFPFLAFLPVN